MFGLDPLSRPVAIAEILLLLAFVAFVGWLLGRLMLAGRISTLQTAINDKKAELDKCRSEKAAGTAGVRADESTGSKPVYPYEAPGSETEIAAPHLFVSTDPLLPAYSHEDTPTPIVNDELAAEINEAAAIDVEETTAPAYVADAPEPVSVIEAPHLFVSTDPLLPAYSHDDTPALLVDDELAAEINDATPPVTGERLSLVGSAFEFPAEDEPEEIVAQEPVIEDRETIVLNRIKTRISEVNFDRIGRATAAQADDLKDIVGVGPFLERKLYTLGIYTYRQVANFTKEDIDKINEIIEFFPGRIERDNWVGQSKAFYERKYGARS